MKESRPGQKKLVKALCDADATSVAPVAAKIAVAEQTLFIWQERFRGQTVDEVKELKSLVAEDAKVAKLVPERLVAIEVLGEVNANSWWARVRRDQGKVSVAHGRPTRSACGLFGVARSSLERTSKIGVNDAPMLNCTVPPRARDSGARKSPVSSGRRDIYG